MNTSICCLAKTAEQAELIVWDLKRTGFSSNDISALLPDTQGNGYLTHGDGTRGPEGATTGGATGLGIGATMGWLAGIGALAIPGAGPFIAAGPLLAAIGGAAAGTAAGSAIGALVGMGIPELEAKSYDAKIREGNILITVHTDDGLQQEVAKDIFKQNDADGISSGPDAKAM